MSTSKNFLMNKGMSYKVTAKARGYYDYATILNPDGTAITYDMTPYDGLNYNVDLTYNAYRDATIDFSQTKLPYLGLVNQSLQTSEYCLKAIGQNYDLTEYMPVYTNITFYGSPAINNDVVSNFSTRNYIVVKKKKSDMTVYLKVTTGSYLSSSQNVASFDGFFDLQVYNNVFGCYDWGANTNYTLLSDITANTTYYWMIKISEADKTKTYSYSTDGKTYTEVKTFTDSGMSYISANDFCLGVHGSNKNNPFYGSISLSGSAIQEKLSSGDYVGYRLNETSIIKKINGTYVNKPEIDYTNNILNPNKINYGDGYVKLTKVHISNNETKVLKLRMSSTPFSNRTLFTLQQMCQFYTSSGSIFFDYKNTSSNWTNNTIVNGGITENVWYSISMEFKLNNTLILKVIKDSDSSVIFEETYTDVDILFNQDVDSAIGSTWEGGNYAYAYCSLNYNDLVTYRTKSYAGIYDPDYVDSGAAKTLNCFSNGNEFVVLSEKENYQNYTYLGTVNIPEHKVNWDEPSTPDTPTTLKFGDRIDNKATVVGSFESSDLGTVVFAVLDSTYYGQYNWASGLNGTDTGLPNYATEDEVLAAKESATYNTDYMLNNYSDKATEAFTYCRSIEPLNFNGKKYNCQLPNAYELKQIYNNSEKLYELDPTTSTNTSYNLANWGFNGINDAWSSNEYNSGTSWELQSVGEWYHYTKDGPSCVTPIIEIPIENAQNQDKDKTGQGKVELQ